VAVFKGLAGEVPITRPLPDGPQPPEFDELLLSQVPIFIRPARSGEANGWHWIVVARIGNRVETKTASLYFPAGHVASGWVADCESN
jgi:hypothetical protein